MTGIAELRLSLAAVALAASLPACVVDVTGELDEATSVCPTATVEGLDISNGNGVIDWSQVYASGRRFAIIKATQGDYYTSAAFPTQWSGAKAAGLVRSPYHFFDPTIDGVAQAKHFLAVVGALGAGDLPPMLDIECPTSSVQSMAQSNCEYGGTTPDSGWVTPAVLNQRIADWLDYAVEAQTGRTPIIYSYNYWFSDSGADSKALLGYPFYVSSPSTGSCYTVGVGNSFTSALIWPVERVRARALGVTGTVDLDRFVGTLEQLQMLAGGGVDAGTPTHDPAPPTDQAKALPDEARAVEPDLALPPLDDLGPPMSDDDLGGGEADLSSASSGNHGGSGCSCGVGGGGDERREGLAWSLLAGVALLVRRARRRR